MRAERIQSSLQPRYWAFNRHGIPMRQIVLLTDGAGEVELDEGRLGIEAPGMLWLGDMRPGRLRADAGATGFRGSAPDATTMAAIGDEIGSSDLRLLSERNFVLSLAGQDEQARLAERCFEGILREIRQPLDGASLVQTALLRIMLVVALRVSAGTEMAIAGAGERTGLLQRFRQLVELNFRNHWTVSRYARALGISADRLHAICTGGLGKPPKALIQERLIHEAMLRLERSPLTIEQFSHTLGFNDPAHFSSFFKRMTGTTPGRFRDRMARDRAAGQLRPLPSFADWP